MSSSLSSFCLPKLNGSYTMLSPSLLRFPFPLSTTSLPSFPYFFVQHLSNTMFLLLFCNFSLFSASTVVRPSFQTIFFFSGHKIFLPSLLSFLLPSNTQWLCHCFFASFYNVILSSIPLASTVFLSPCNTQWWQLNLPVFLPSTLISNTSLPLLSSCNT